MSGTPKKIVYLINGLGSGGAEMMLYRLLERLDWNKYQPVVIALLKFGGPLQEKITALGIDVHVVGVKSKLDLRSLARLYRLLKSLSPDILQTQLFAADIMGRTFGRLLKVPVIVTSIRNTYYGGFGRNLLIRLTERFADKTTFVSRTALERFVKLGIVSEEKAILIYNGLDPDRFCNGLTDKEKTVRRRELGFSEDVPLILAVGSLTRQKGYSDLLRALLILNQQQVAFKLAVAGSGPLKNELAAEVRELGLEENVSFLGRSDQIAELMASAELLVLASLWEGLPGVVLEAMASELPVVATAVGGTPELVVEGQTGYLVPPGDSEGLAAKLRKVLSLSKPEREKLGSTGRKRVEEYFTLSKMVSAYEKLYTDLLNNKTLA